MSQYTRDEIRAMIATPATPQPPAPEQALPLTDDREAARQVAKNADARDAWLTQRLRRLPPVTLPTHELTDVQRAALRARGLPETWDAWLQFLGYWPASGRRIHSSGYETASRGQ